MLQSQTLLVTCGSEGLCAGTVPVLDTSGKISEIFHLLCLKEKEKLTFLTSLDFY